MLNVYIMPCLELQTTLVVFFINTTIVFKTVYSSHLLVLKWSWAGEACYWLKRVLHSGWLCITSWPAFYIQERCGSMLVNIYMHVCGSLYWNNFLVQFNNRLYVLLLELHALTLPACFFCALDCGNWISIWSPSQHKLYTHGSIVKTISFKAKVYNFYLIPPTISYYWNPFIRFGGQITPNQNKAEDIGLFVFGVQLDNNKLWCSEGARVWYLRERRD